MSDGNSAKPEKEIEVHVLELRDFGKANFKVDEQITLQGLWDDSYIQLGVKKQPGDGFQAVEGEGAKKQATDLAPYLSVTLAQAIVQGLTKTEHFEITVGTGGA